MPLEIDDALQTCLIVKQNNEIVLLDPKTGKEINSNSENKSLFKKIRDKISSKIGAIFEG